MEQRVAIVRAPPTGKLTGGNVFNRRILREARRRGWPLDAISAPVPGSRALDWDALLWDSLLIEQVQRLGRERIGLLLHYLPSLEPGLSPAQARSRRAAEDHAVHVSQLCIATSRELAAIAAARWPGRRTLVCEPGVSAEFRRRKGGTAAAAAVLLTVANLVPAKGHERLLGVLARIRRPPWHWHVVGDFGMDPEVRERLQAHARQAGLADRITLHEPLPQRQVAAMMRAADILLQPSVFESYGMVLAEAAASGLPAVAFRVGAAERLIRHGTTGLLAPAGDWDAFGRHVHALLDDAALRIEFERNLAGLAVRGWDAALADFRLACEALLAY